jgi:hypothetical protein
MAFKFDLRGLLEDENFLIGAGLLTAGAKGQSLGEAAFPTIINAAKTQKMFKDTAKSTKSVYDVELKKNVLKTDLEIKKNPNRYEPPKTAQKPTKETINDRTLAVFDKLNQAKNDEEFRILFDSLSKPDQALYNNKIAGNPDAIDQAVAAKIENSVTLDVEQMAAVSEYKLGKKVEGFESVQAVVEAQMANNPDAAFDQILESLIQAGIIEK